MPGKKDAAWWRAHRAKKRLEQQQSAGLQDTATPQPQAQPGVAADGYRGGLHDLTPILTGFPDGTVEFADGRAPKSYSALTLAQRVAAGLAAPDDDCMSCGHDRQAFHTGTPYCLAPVSYGRGGVCRCPAFVDSAAPF